LGRGKQELPADGDLKARFTEVFMLNTWRDSESASGPGSRRNSPCVKASTEALRLITQNYQIGSIVDIPCGDFNWMHEFLGQFPRIAYSGFDIVEPLIRKNQALFPEFDFSTLDITSDVPPRADLIFCKDLFNHLTYGDISRAIENMKASHSTYLLASNNFGWENKELHDNEGGASRHFDLTAGPFNFPAPIWQNAPGAVGANYLGLWKLADLTPPPISAGDDESGRDPVSAPAVMQM
jgi:hypothetical protein